MTTETTTAITLPAILTANTYFWKPNSSARGRRSNEERYEREVAAFLATHADALRAAGIEVEFEYRESCSHVYKSLTVYRNGKKSNITAIKKAIGIK